MIFAMGGGSYLTASIVTGAMFWVAPELVGSEYTDPLYSSSSDNPERARSISTRSDIYSFGSVMLQVKHATLPCMITESPTIRYSQTRYLTIISNTYLKLRWSSCWTRESIQNDRQKLGLQTSTGILWRSAGNMTLLIDQILRRFPKASNNFILPFFKTIRKYNNSLTPSDKTWYRTSQRWFVCFQ